MSIHEELARIQQSLHAPKTNRNDFGKYNYRSAEGILAAVKPLLNGCTITVSDDIVIRNDRVYVQSTACLSDGKSQLIATAYAREAVVKKGMDDAQITGSCASYSKKYALGNLFAIDNEDDADTKQGPSVIEQINNCYTRDEMTSLWRQMSKAEQEDHKEEFMDRAKQIEDES